MALDARFHRTGSGEFVLHHNLGSPCTPNDFQPLETVLKPGVSKRITAAGGRPSNSDWPYFNVAGPGAGVIVAVGWPGQWAADFTADATGGLLNLKLRGPEPSDRYALTNLDSGETQTFGGRELLDEGLAVAITAQPGSAVTTYKKAQ